MLRPAQPVTTHTHTVGGLHWSGCSSFESKSSEPGCSSSCIEDSSSDSSSSICDFCDASVRSLAMVACCCAANAMSVPRGVFGSWVKSCKASSLQAVIQKCRCIRISSLRSRVYAHTLRIHELYSPNYFRHLCHIPLHSAHSWEKVVKFLSFSHKFKHADATTHDARELREE